MKIHFVLHLFVQFLVVQINYSQSEQHILDDIDSAIEIGNDLDSITYFIEKYQKFCKSEKCKQVEYIQYLSLSFQWHLKSRTELISKCNDFMVNYPNSSFYSEVEKLVDWKKDFLKVGRDMDQIAMTNSLDNMLILCNRYQSVGNVYLLCKQRELALSLTVISSLSYNDGNIYHLKYAGHEGMAPNIKCSILSDTSLYDIISSNSLESKIFIHNRFSGSLIFSISGSPWKSYIFSNNHSTNFNNRGGASSSDLSVLEKDVNLELMLILFFVIIISLIIIFIKLNKARSIVIYTKNNLNVVPNIDSIKSHIDVYTSSAGTNKFNSINQDYINIDLSKTWSSTLIRTISILPRIVGLIQNHIMDPAFHNLEIGGFLIGSYLRENEHYFIYIDDYIDIESSDQSEFQIEFGKEAWTKLEKFLETSNKHLVGWFHTHPGHGVFLSRPDRSIVSNFFNQPYHIAMVIDPVEREQNRNLDTAFFTHKVNGDINNKADVLNKWFSWKDIIAEAKIAGF